MLVELHATQNHDYVIISGARRKEQRWDPHENEQIVPEGLCCTSISQWLLMHCHNPVCYQQYTRCFNKKTPTQVFFSILEENDHICSEIFVRIWSLYSWRLQNIRVFTSYFSKIPHLWYTDEQYGSFLMNVYSYLIKPHCSLSGLNGVGKNLQNTGITLECFCC